MVTLNAPGLEEFVFESEPFVLNPNKSVVLFRGHHRETDGKIILKLLKTDSSETSYRRFVEEQLAHKEIVIETQSENNANAFLVQREAASVVPVLGTISKNSQGSFLGPDDQSYQLGLWMPYYKSGCLASRLASGTQLEIEEAVAMVKLVAKRVDAFHKGAKELIHRDIKPANILIDDDGYPAITDFGISKTSSSENLTIDGGPIGTIAFMAPEQFTASDQIFGSDQSLNRTTDVFGLGATLYSIATGQTPFSDIAYRDDSKLVRPRKLNNRISRDLEAVILKAIAPLQKDRYATAMAFAHDLENIQAGLAPTVVPENFAGKVTRWIIRNRWVAASILSLIVALGVVIAFSMMTIRAKNNLMEANAKLKRSEQRAISILQLYDDVADDYLTKTPQSTGLRKQIYIKEIEHYEELESLFATDFSRELGETHHRLGDVEDELGERAEAEISYQKAIESWNRSEIKPAINLRIAHTYQKIADQKRKSGQIEESLKLFDEAKRIFDNPATRQCEEWERMYAGFLNDFGEFQFAVGKPRAELFEKAIELISKPIQENPQDDWLIHLSAKFHTNLGVHGGLKLKRSIENLETALGLFNDAINISPAEYRYRSAKGVLLRNLGVMYFQNNDLANARIRTEESRDVFIDLTRNYPRQHENWNRLGVSYSNLGFMAASNKEFEKTAEFESLAIGAKTEGYRILERESYFLSIGESYGNMVEAYISAGKFAQAKTELSAAKKLLDESKHDQNNKSIADLKSRFSDFLDTIDRKSESN